MLIDTPLGLVKDAAPISTNDIVVFVKIFGKEVAVEGDACGEGFMPRAVAISDDSNAFMGDALDVFAVFFDDIATVVNQEGYEGLFHG